MFHPDTSSCIIEMPDGRLKCKHTGQRFRADRQPIFCACGHMPTLPHQAWNLARSLAAFMSDGCHTVTADEYRARLEVCDTCKHRHGTRCLKCGCCLSLKAQGRAFECPANKWPF